MIIREDRYNMELSMFLNKKENKGKSEVDYLNYQIAKFKEIYESCKTDEQIEKSVTKEFNKHNNEDEENYAERLQYEIDYKIRDKNNKLNQAKNFIKYYKLRLKRFPESYEEINDFSNTKGTEKIVMLYELGIFDFLVSQHPFNLSKNALATVISQITGVAAPTVQSYINPINNPSVDQKNNPLKSERTVNKVKQILISIGFNPTD